jgi:hypothetical protein
MKKMKAKNKIQLPPDLHYLYLCHCTLRFFVFRPTVWGHKIMDLIMIYY